MGALKVLCALLTFLFGGLAAIVGCLFGATLDNYQWAARLAFFFGLIWILINQATGGLILGPIQFHPHDSLKLEGIPTPLLNTFKVLFCATVGARVGHEFRKGLREMKTKSSTDIARY